MHRLREARQSLVSFIVNGVSLLNNHPLPRIESMISRFNLFGIIMWAFLMSSFISFELGWGFKHWSHLCWAQRPWCKVDGALMRYDLLKVRDLDSIITSFLTKSSLLHDQPIINDQWGLCLLITWPWGLKDAWNEEYKAQNYFMMFP